VHGEPFCGTILMWYVRTEVRGAQNGTVDLLCKEDVWTNSNWTIGHLYQIGTTTCQPAELQFIPVITHN
jgi:hypothetical protein